MNQSDQERNIPVFIFVSMVIHALLFLYAPQLLSGIIPGHQTGDAGRLSFVTLIDPPTAQQVSAPRPTEETPPRSTPEPLPVQEPEPARVEVTPEAPSIPEPEPVAIEAPPTTTPEITPAERVQVAEAPTATQPSQVRPQPVAPEPDILTSTRGPEIAVETMAAPTVPEATLAPARRNEPVAHEVIPTPETPQIAEIRPVESGGTGDVVEVPSSIPQAEPAPEPALPPRGESMTDFSRLQGGLPYPKRAVDLLRETVTVQVAAIVNTRGEVIEVIIIESSGIDEVDQQASGFAQSGIIYSPHTDIYELRVHVTYNHTERTVSHHVGEFIQSPPTVGQFGI